MSSLKYVDVYVATYLSPITFEPTQKLFSDEASAKDWLENKLLQAIYDKSHYPYLLKVWEDYHEGGASVIKHKFVVDTEKDLY